MSRLHTCPVCGTMFEAPGNRRVYCGNICKWRRKNELRAPARAEERRQRAAERAPVMAERLQELLRQQGEAS